jgi:predicted DCC family thiol-disulfide oxidoreductase YuxK
MTASWAARHLKSPVALVPWQKVDLMAHGLREKDVRRAAWWMDGRGGREKGHRAVGRVLMACGGFWAAVGRLLLLPPPVEWLGAAGYAAVARLRHLLPGTTPACRERREWDGAPDRPCREG